MILKTLDISGFKSFARHTRIELPAGISAFVGPNGSGKSNVVDAVRWALGEQNVRDLRGQRSDDVIYSGARRAVGVAEVTLMFEEENSHSGNGLAGLAVSRRLYRNGESEYLVNGSRSRLRDLVTALHDADIDTGRNLIVTQGMADSLLSAGPVERRSLLEQAAGLSGYRDRRDDADHKLASVLRNIETAELVLAEMEPRLRLLARQAKALEEREESADRLRAALTAWYVDKFSRSDAAQVEARRQVQNQALHRHEMAENLERLENAAAASLEAERQRHAEIQRRTAIVHQIQRDRDSLLNEIARLDRDCAEYANRSVAIARRLHDVGCPQQELKARREEIVAERQQVRASLESKHSDLRSLHELIADAQAKLNEADAQVERRNVVLTSVRSALQSLLAEREQVHRQLDVLAERMASAEARRAEVANEVISVRDERTKRVQELLEAGIEEERAAAIHGHLQHEADTAKSRLERLKGLVRRSRVTHAELQRQRDATLRTIEGLGRDIEGGLIEGLTVAPGMERAVSAALGSWTGTKIPGLVTERIHFSDGRSLLEWRQGLESQIGTTLHWVDEDVEGFPPRYVNPLSVTVVASNATTAEALWDQLKYLPGAKAGSVPLQVVTQDGTVWNGVGVRALKPDDSGSRLLLARAAKDRLDRRQRLVVNRLSALDKALGEAADAVEKRHSDAKRAAQELRAYQTAKQLLASTCRDMERSIERLVALEDTETGILLGIQHDVTVLSARVQTLDAGRSAAESRVQTEFEALTEMQQSQSRLREQYSSLSTRVGSLQQEGEVLQLQSNSLDDRIRLLESELYRLSQELTQLERETEQVDVLTGRARAEQEQHQLRLADVEQLLAVQEDSLTEEKNRPTLPGAPPEELRHAREQASAAVRDHEKALSRIAWLDQERKELEGRLQDDLGMTSESLPVEADPPPNDETLRRLRARAHQYGELDPAVAVEYAELAQRSRYLAEHVADLQEAERNLRQIMTVADREMKDRFRLVFDQVNEEFGQTFRLMLRGGEGSLEMADEGGGVEIRAQLPGRKARTSTAFSGGERTLVASSLLFAVLRVRPSPFCVLDEVDAALDESNVDRYLTVLRELSAATQIIVVTHNRATMAAADVLYGLTMDDEGVSGLLSLRLDAFGKAV